MYRMIQAFYTQGPSGWLNNKGYLKGLSFRLTERTNIQLG